MLLGKTHIHKTIYRFDGSNPNIKEILIQLFANCGNVVSITILKNVLDNYVFKYRWRG